MKVSIQKFQGKKYLVVGTGIKEADYRKGITNAELYDEDGFEILTVDFNVGGSGRISADNVTVNGVEGGEFTICTPLFDSAKVDDIKTTYGAALVALKPKFAALIEKMHTEAADIDEIFADVEEEDAATEAEEVTTEAEDAE